MTTQEIKINIERLENTISQNFWNKGYVQNCLEEIERYKKMLIWLMNEMPTQPSKNQ